MLVLIPEAEFNFIHLEDDDAIPDFDSALFVTDQSEEEEFAQIRCEMNLQNKNAVGVKAAHAFHHVIE